MRLLCLVCLFVYASPFRALFATGISCPVSGVLPAWCPTPSLSTGELYTSRDCCLRSTAVLSASVASPGGPASQRPLLPSSLPAVCPSYHLLTRQPRRVDRPAFCAPVGTGQLPVFFLFFLLFFPSLSLPSLTFF